MNTVKETLDTLFEKERRVGELAQKCKRAIGVLAGEYILEILTEKNEKHGIPFVCYEEIIYRLRKKEARFTSENVNEGLYILNLNRQARYIMDGCRLLAVGLMRRKND